MHKMILYFSLFENGMINESYRILKLPFIISEYKEYSSKLYLYMGLYYVMIQLI